MSALSSDREDAELALLTGDPVYMVGASLLLAATDMLASWWADGAADDNGQTLAYERLREVVARAWGVKYAPTRNLEDLR